MASPSAATDITPKFPSFEPLWDAACHTKPGEELKFPIATLSLDGLRWSLDGPLETSVSVMADRWISPGLPPDEPYYQKPALSGNGSAASGSGSGSWHPISQDSLVEPKVSSIIVDVDELDRWEQNWVEGHEGHYYDGDDMDPTQTRIGPLPGADPDDPTGGWHYETGHYTDENGEYTWHLLRCCGVDRPLNSRERFKFVVEAKEECGFLTVYVYVDQVHRRLMGWREEIVVATAVARVCMGSNEPFSREEKRMVSAKGRWVDLVDEKEWAYQHRR